MKFLFLLIISINGNRSFAIDCNSLLNRINEVTGSLKLGEFTTTNYQVSNVTRKDLNDLKRIFQEPSLEELSGFILNDEEVKNIIRMSSSQYMLQTGWIDYAATIRARQTGEIIGVIDYHNHTPEGTAQIACYLDKRYWRMGVVNEIAPDFIKLGFKNLNIKRIEAEAYDFNVPSNQAIKKMGFLNFGTRKDEMDRTLNRYYLLQNE